MRSAWLKWARAVEHQKYLARLGREFFAEGPTHAYIRSDNSADSHDELLRIEWRLKVIRTYPDRRGVILGDAVGNLRAALDNALFAAVVKYSGWPAKPESIYFPIRRTEAGFGRVRRELKPLVNAQTWEVVEALQPFHGGDLAHTSPLAILQWMSNIDKHRSLHVVGQTQIDIEMPLLAEGAGGPLEVIEQEMIEGQSNDGGLVGRATIRRPAESGEIDVTPTFAHIASVQVCDEPESEYRSLASVTEVMTSEVLATINAVTSTNDFEMPNPDEFELGLTHDDYFSEYGGMVGTFQDLSGTRHNFRISSDPAPR